MKTINLNGEWRLSGKQQESEDEPLVLKAEVPGCVQLDLSREGYLPEDLYLGENIKETEKFEDWEWQYERTFTAPLERENVYIVFEGVDCVADYFINGQKIGESKNMLVEHEFEIGKYLKDGENTVAVNIKSAVIAAHYAEYDIISVMSWGDKPVETSLRRPPHSYGWDIMPRAVTSGLWRDVKIEVRDKIYFSQLFVKARNLTQCDIAYELDCKWSDFKNVELAFKGRCGDDSGFEVRFPVNGAKISRKTVNINNPKLWWPYGYGEPNVYDVTAQIYKDGQLVHEEKTSFGLRTVKLERTDITNGENGQFRFLINNIEIMCKGSNWVPMDAFHSRDAQRYERALELVKDIGCNILRCWGGNVYEDHEFFNFCDRNGIMIWQDFAMACRLYPETESFKKQLFDEAEKVVRKLRNHPSIILWSGDNEVDQLLLSVYDPNKNSLTREVLPTAVRLNDFGRPYLASSPFISTTAYENSRKGTSKYPTELPEDHLWGPRDYYKSDFYKQNKSHFVSETGYFGCPSLETLKKYLTPEKVWPYSNNSEWILHSSDQSGNNARVMQMEKQVKQLFGEVPEKPEDFIIASQISQAEAKKYFIERIRVDRPHKTGVIWWNLIDGWPQMSDAVVDYYYDKKIAYGYIKRSQAPFVIAAGEISDWTLPIYACNDTLEGKSGTFTVIDAETDEILFESGFEVGANQSKLLTRMPIYYSDHKFLIMKWNMGVEEGLNHYLCGYPPFDLEKYKLLMQKYGL